MGYGNKSVSGKHNISNLGAAKMGGKAHGGGVKLSPKKENTGGGMDSNQKEVMAGDYSPAKSGIISGGHSKGNFMSTPKFKQPHKELKPVPADKQKSLGQLPTKARNNMGFEKHGPEKANYDKDMAEERIQIKDDKEKIFQDDKEKRESEGFKKIKNYKK